MKDARDTIKNTASYFTILLKTNLTAIHIKLLSCSPFLIATCIAYAQPPYQNDSQNSFLITEQSLKSFEDIPDDLMDVNNNLKKLEEFKQILIQHNYELTNYNAFNINAINPSSEVFSERLKSLKSKIADFKRLKNEDGYYNMQDEYNGLLASITLFFSNNRTRSSLNENQKLYEILKNANEQINRIYTETIGENPSQSRIYAYDEVLSDSIKNSTLNTIELKSKRLEKVNVKVLVNSLNEQIKKLRVDIDKAIDDNYNIESKIDNLLKRHKSKKKELNRDINEWGIQTGLPWFCGTVAFLFLITVLHRRINIPFKFSKDSKAPFATQASENQEHISRVLLEVITVLLLTLTILILGLSNILKENVLGTLIGGIAGYILNRTKGLNEGFSNDSNHGVNSSISKNE